jgi:hypothetical protein
MSEAIDGRFGFRIGKSVLEEFIIEAGFGQMRVAMISVLPGAAHDFMLWRPSVFVQTRVALDGSVLDQLRSLV